MTEAEAIGLSGNIGTAVAWTRDGLVELGGLLASEPDSVPRSINKRGDIVGDSLFSRSTWPFQRHGFVWRDGAMTDLGTLPGRAESYAAAINDRGEIAGTAYDIGFGSNLVLWSDGAIHDLGEVRAGSAWVTDMNKRRQIVGYAVFGSDQPPLPLAGRRVHLPAVAHGSRLQPSAVDQRPRRDRRFIGGRRRHQTRRPLARRRDRRPRAPARQLQHRGDQH